MRLKLRKRSAGQSGPRRNKSRFPGRSAQKRPTRNIAGEKRVREEEVDSDYLFANHESILKAYSDCVPRLEMPRAMAEPR